MTLLSVKVFDINNKELYSSVSISNDLWFYNLIPYLGKLARESEREQVQALIYNNYLIAFFNILPENSLLVAIASVNTSLRKLEHFLGLLSHTMQNSKRSLENFQDVCDSIIRTVDSHQEVKISLLGLERSGKTTFVNSFAKDRPLAEFEAYYPTSLLNIVRMEHIHDLPPITFFDLGKAFSQQWWRFSSESDGYIYFVDSSDSHRMKQAQVLLQELRNFWDLPFVIAANKIDVCRITNVKKYIGRKFQVSSRKVYEINTWTGTGILPLLKGLINNEIEGTKISVSLVHPTEKMTG